MRRIPAGFSTLLVIIKSAYPQLEIRRETTVIVTSLLSMLLFFIHSSPLNKLSKTNKLRGSATVQSFQKHFSTQQYPRFAFPLRY